MTRKEINYDPKELFTFTVKISRGTDRIITDLVRLGAFSTKSEFVRTAVLFFLKEASGEIMGIYRAPKELNAL